MIGLSELRRFWPVIPIVMLLAWAARLDQLRGQHLLALTTEQANRRVDAAEAGRDRAHAEAGFSRQLATATEAYALRLADRQPIIIHSRDTVTRYAQTPDGRALCLPADRVRGAQADRDALFTDPAGSPDRGGNGLPSGSADHPS